MKKKVERMNQLIEILQKQKNVSIKELAKLLHVSEMTIRRDLEVLRDRGIILNVHGVAIYNPNNTYEKDDDSYSLAAATTAHVKEKDSIGAYGASLIQPGECVIIDNGSTTERLAAHINVELQATILSCNVNILNKLCNKPNLSIIFGGGYFHRDTNMLESPESISLIKKTRASKVFVSAAGIHETLGVTCVNNYELPTKQAIMESGAERIILADSSKFGEVRTCFFAELSDFHKIITDKNLSPDWVEKIQELGIELVMV